MSAIEGMHCAALRCLKISDPLEKVEATRRASEAWRNGELHIEEQHVAAPERVIVPGRPTRPELVDSKHLPRRGLGTAIGRAALIHAVAHIEFNAINLAWDAVYRFRDMPSAFYDDWISVADDESRHFGLLLDRLACYGHTYGSFDAHNGLWQMALKTDHDCLVRMALVPRVLEARGLDVTPGMIERFRSTGDEATADVLEIILKDEVGHVAAGSRWFRWCCDREGQDPEQAFLALLSEFDTEVKPPLNRSARHAAGFSEVEMDRLIDRMPA